MIKIEKRVGGVRIKDPENLIPIVFKCVNCKSTIRKLEDTNSYVLMSTSKEVDSGSIPACEFCRRLLKYQGVTE